MVKILKKSKKPISTHPKVNAVILAIQDAPDHDLPGILNAVSYWHWPRTDLHYWIKALNRFDSILEEICKSYNVREDHIQVNEFTPRTKELILSIIRFSRLLLENATNRKLYSSFDRMNDLLLTQDPDILEAALRLIFRRAQQVAANGAPIPSGETFSLTPRRVANLTFGWKPVRQAGLSMFDLVSEQLSPSAISAIERVDFQFYRKASASSSAAANAATKESEAAGDAIAMTPAATPAPKSAMKSSRPTPGGPSTPSAAQGQSSSKGQTDPLEQEGMTTINLGNVNESGKAATDVLMDAMELYRVPQEEKLRLLQRIRVGMAIRDANKRRQMLRIRLLAIGVLIHTHPDNVAESEIFLHEPDFITQLAELVQPNKSVPMDVRTVALLALDTCCRVDNRVNDVTAALSVSVNHGTLMSILRKLSADLHSDHPETTAEYVDALFSFLTFLQTAHYAGNMLHGAGAIPLLVDLVKETKLTHDALLVANRAVTFLDNFTYSFPNASGPFATAGGLQVFVERVRQLVAAGVAVSSDSKTMDTEDVNPLMQLNDPNVLSYGESTLLKSLFRCLQRLMNSGQNTEGVRQLIDSSLVESCKLVMKHRHAFGPQNFALAVTIMLTFVHNEPTSLTVLQESKVPDVFYEAIRGDIEPSLDVLSVIPTAIGALCLNEAGLNQFESQCADILDKFFTTFLSEKHARILNERENAVIIGANFDELVRHHPSLKQPVLEAITSLLKKIYEEGKDYAPDTAEGYRLQLVSDDKPATSGHASNYQAGEKQGSSASDVNMSEQAAGNEAAGIETADLDHKRDDNRLLASVAVTGRFLEGFFTTPSHCKDYIKKDGLDHLLRLFTLPCIPFDVHHHAPFPGLTTVFLTISEHSPDQLLRALMNQAKEALTDLTDFWQPEDISQQPIDTAKLERTVEDMLQPRSSEALDRANKTFRALVKAQHVLTIMSELHSTDAYVTRQPSSQILSLLRNPERTQTIQELCGLLRACTFAAVKLKGISPNSGSASLASSLQSTASQGASQPTPGATSNENDGADVAMSTAGANSAVVDDGKAAAWPATTSANAKALKMVLLAIPDSLKSFLQGIMGLHATRRSSVDNQQRKDATFVAHAISLGVAQNLRWPDSPNNSANFEYATLMIKFLVDLLQVERSTTGGLHLIFLKALDKQEGTDRLLSLHARYVEEVAELSRIPESERDSPSRLRLIHAVGGLKVILNVFETLTSHRFLLSAGHLLLLTQDRSSQSFFDPYAFLVKLRCRILPAVASTWNADFLAQSPPIIVRAVFRILLQILEGQGESGEGDAAASFTSVLPTRPQVVASPTLVQSLVEMGFPRAACEQALVRRNNNLATAADYLMSHPEIVAAARAREEQDAGNGQQEPEAVDNPSQAEAAASESESRLSPADVDMTDAPSGRGTPLPPPVADEAESGNVSAQLQGTGKTKPAKKYTRAELDAHRDQVKETFISRALALAQDHGELVFDIRQALKTIDLKLPGQEPYDTSRGLNAILQDLTSKLATGPPSTPEEDRSTTARVRLVALIFSDPAFRRAVDTSYVKAMEPVMRLVEDYNRQKYSVESRPKWLSSILLLSELILARAELPKDAEASSGEVTNPSEILRGPAFEVEREALFNLSLDVLQKTVSDRDLLQSTLRVVLMLTRQTATAQKFIEQGGLQALMQNYARGRRDTEGFQEFAIMILRHTVEDRVAVKAVMENHIQAWLSKARKAVVTDSYVKDLNADACRDVPTFLDLTADLCRLISVSGGYGVTTKQEKIESSSADAPPVADGDETLKIDKHDASMHIDDLTKALPSSTPASPAAENVMHFLITEAVAATQAALKAPSNLPDVSTVGKTSPSATSSNLPSEAAGTDTSAPAHVGDANVPVSNATSSASSEPVEQPVSQSIKDFTYASFLLTCISELAASYTTCKASLISWSKRKNDGAAPSSKSGRWKSSFLYHLLAHVIPTASPNLGKDLQSRKRFALSTKAINVIISVCHDNTRNPFDPKSVISSEITNIRKTVLDGIAKAFKEAESTQEDVDARYGRLSALSVLCSRLLAPPATVSGQPSAAGAQNDMAMQMAKIMLEKNYASLLTSALGDIDFNHPDALILIEAILLPLENLTNLVTKLGRNTQAEITRTDSATPVQPAVVASESLSSEDEDADSEDMEIEDEGDLENEEDEDDRAASDVYRNSALGMFQGELEPANAEEQYSSDDAMEEDMQEWDDEEDEMMEDEGAVPSDISDESEGEEDMMDLAHEVEEELDAEDEDEDGSSQDEDDEDEEGEHDEDEDDEHDDDLEELDDGPAIDMQADIAAALRNGHLEPVDDFTSRLINEQMNMFGEPADGGMIQAHFGDNNQLQDDDNDNLEEGDAPDDEDDESDGDDDDGDDVNDRVVHGGNVAEIFDNLLGGHGGAGLDESNVHVSVVGGPSGGERILSIDIGGPPPPAFARRSAPRSNQARHLGQHSLLTDNTEAGRRGGRGDFMGGSRHRHRAGREGADFNDWVQSLEDMIGNGAGQLLEQVFGNMPAMNASTGPLAAIANRPPTDTRNPVDLLQNLISGLNRGTAGSRHRHIHQADHRPASANIEMQLVTEAINNTLPNPPTTTDRWSDESAIFSGGLQASERISIIAKRVNAILLPEKQRRDQEQREKDAKEREERDREIREREEKEAAEAVRKAAEEQTAINQSRDAEMSTNTAGEQTEAVQAPVQAPQGSEIPQTPVNAGAATGERLSWRERIERRRQAQAAQGSDHQGIVGAADGTPSVPQGSSLRDSLLDRANGGDLAEVLDLAARLSAAGPASSSNLQGGENHSTAPVDAAPDVHMDREESAVAADEPTVGDTTEQVGEESQASAPLAGPSTAPERITIQVRGNTIDITDTGIDPTFLEALPDDMREEVLNQHFRETRAAAAPTTQSAPTSINAEFLDALPPELRAEVLAQEALEAARVRAAAAAAAAPAPQATTEAGAGTQEEGAAPPVAAEPAEMDPVAFLASLDPHLRQTVLMEQGEDMLTALPPDMLEEYRALRDQEIREHGGFRRHLPRRTDLNQFRTGAGAVASRKAVPTVKRDAVQLLDKTGVAALVRLLFFPSHAKKNTLASILKHLCENSKTRIEIINLLLTVLYEGTRETGSGGETVDKTISALTSSSQVPLSANKNAKTGGKGKGPAPPSTPGLNAGAPASSHIAGLPHHLIASGPGENIPTIAVQKSLETLAHLVNSNESSAAFFLSEQELPLNLTGNKRPPQSSKRDKGKGRPSEVALSKEKVYPIIVLFSLMDRKTLTDSPVIMEALTKLLASITVPLRHLDLTGALDKATVGDTSNAPSSSTAGGSAAVDTPAISSTNPATPAAQVPAAESTSLTKPPQLPAAYLKMVVHVLDLGECSSKMFSAALMLIHHLWLLPDARATISTELIALAQKYGSQLLTELAELKKSLAAKSSQAAGQEAEAEVLRRFSQASSSQTKLLRVLKTIEYAKQQQARAIKRRRILAEKRKEEVDSKKGDVPSEYEEILKEKEKASSTEADTAMETEDKEKAKAEAIKANYERQLAKVEAELKRLKSEEEAEQHKVEELYDGFDFSPVWTKLSDCLTVMEEESDVGSSAGTLLPLIEAFLMVSSWGLEGVDINALYHDTPAMLPTNQARASLSPMAQPVSI